MNIVDVLQRFSSVRVTAAQLFELLPRLQARYYSIASSDKVLQNANINTNNDTTRKERTFFSPSIALKISNTVSQCNK